MADFSRDALQPASHATVAQPRRTVLRMAAHRGFSATMPGARRRRATRGVGGLARAPACPTLCADDAAASPCAVASVKLVSFFPHNQGGPTHRVAVRQAHAQIGAEAAPPPPRAVSMPGRHASASHGAAGAVAGAPPAAAARLCEQRRQAGPRLAAVARDDQHIARALVERRRDLGATARSPPRRDVAVVAALAAKVAAEEPGRVRLVARVADDDVRAAARAIDEHARLVRGALQSGVSFMSSATVQFSMCL